MFTMAFHFMRGDNPQAESKSISDHSAWIASPGLTIVNIWNKSAL